MMGSRFKSGRPDALEPALLRGFRRSRGGPSYQSATNFLRGDRQNVRSCFAMDDDLAAHVANKLANHPASGTVVINVIRQVLAARVPDGAVAGLALDESDEAVIVAVSGGRAIRLKPLGESTQDFSTMSEVLRFDHPTAKSSVAEVAVSTFSGELFIHRSWRYELGDGSSLRVTINEESSPEDEALEAALAAAAGWPTA